ncbi:TetR/AcrR family transcriptional regulator [Pseudonocardia humida]|uniref:TetR/AcrR family transcriptional regulator n=1 Tax=Pseudonocardia humida TaxID=2800819 RepID=A0ABT1AAD2_9PSEU|nr:TetR/AcrR family transcriptional regulator [Pseudonocardia humida]MCO1659774.1 TetR/AcrR family transcriptional regulator [Pseudonocardia humida]
MSAGDLARPTRRTELLELAYRYVLEHGLSDLSLRPLATAVGSSPRVLLYLFGSKDRLITALLARARADELRLLALARRPAATPAVGLDVVVEDIWDLLVSADQRPLLALWVEGCARSLRNPGPIGRWCRGPFETVDDWLSLLADGQPPAVRGTEDGRAERVLALAVLRGALIDMLLTGDVERTTAAVRRHCTALRGAQ